MIEDEVTSLLQDPGVCAGLLVTWFVTHPSHKCPLKIGVL